MLIPILLAGGALVVLLAASRRRAVTPGLEQAVRQTAAAIDAGTATSDAIEATAAQADREGASATASTLRKSATVVRARERAAKTLVSPEAAAAEEIAQEQARTRAFAVMQQATADTPAPARGDVPRLLAPFSTQLNQITSVEGARKYAQQGYHVSLDRAEATTGEAHDRWILAARDYLTAYRLTVQTPVPPFAEIVYALEAADGTALEASGGTVTRSSEGLRAPSRSLVPRTTTRAVARSAITTGDQAKVYAQRGFHASLDSVAVTTGAARDRWINAANLYALAYQQASKQPPDPLEALAYTLEAADRVASEARGIGGA